VDPNGLSTTLENPNTQPTVFDVEVQGDPRQSLIALPGSARTEGKVGEGNLEDFAKALAGRYRIPVEIHVAEPNVSVSWNFEAADPEGAASQTLSASRYNIDRLGNGMLVISDPGA
jgi:hypothetical protein